ARMDAAAKTTAARSVVGSFQTNEQAFLQEIHRFAPEVTDLLEADERLRTSAQRRRELNNAQDAVRERALRREILEEQRQESGDGFDDTREPVRTKEEVVRELDRARQDLEEARSGADNLTGQLHAVGDLVVLRSAAARTQDDLGILEEEYEALKLASDTLDHANAALQTRFSPALAKRASEIFKELTEGRYENLSMDRSFHMFAETGDVYRSSMYLSAGCADQMYLAVRLAICELVLPVDRVVPIVLDDALTNFDDQRCAAALRFLKKEAEKRQILLFTCHSREAAFFAGDSGVFVQRLPGAK
ncbi:MAG: hypothetical protein IJT94_17015, partial [Oscillibacter sp.]|nr:hypothetical protein [Oscillibacter sp.]